MDKMMELRESLANLLYGETTYNQYLAVPEVRRNAEQRLDQILALIKEAGYKSPKEVAEFGLSVNEAAYLQGKAEGRKADGEPPKLSIKEIIAWAKEHGYYSWDCFGNEAISIGSQAQRDADVRFYARNNLPNANKRTT